MKRQIYILFALVLFIGLSGSAGLASDYFTLDEYYQLHPEQVEKTSKFKSIVQQQGKAIKAGVQSKPVTIAFVYPGKQASDYWRRSITSFTSRMDEINVNYEIYEYFSEPNVKWRVEEQQVLAALEKDPDYLVYTLNIFKHRRLIERILIQGRPKLILQNITTPVKDWEGIQPFLYVGFDHAVGTKTFLAEKLLQLTGGTGDYAMLYFTEGYVSLMRGDTLIQYLAGNSQHKLVSSFYTDGKREKAKLATREIVYKHDVKFIFACSTDIALGALDALRELGKLDEVIVNGWGGGSGELAAIKKGELDLTVMRINDDNGVAMAEAIRLDIEQKGDDVPVVFSGDFAVVTKETKDNELNELRQRAFRYSGME